jgi:hypothetical protein
MDVVLKFATPELLYVVLAGLSVNGLTQAIKTWFNLQKDWVKVLLALSLSLVAAAIQIVNNTATLDPSALGPHTLEIAGFATVLYQLALKPLFAVFGIAKQVNAIETQAAAQNKAVKETPPFLLDDTTTVGDYLESEQKPAPKVFPY